MRKIMKIIICKGDRNDKFWKTGYQSRLPKFTVQTVMSPPNYSQRAFNIEQNLGTLSMCRFGRIFTKTLPQMYL